MVPIWSRPDPTEHLEGNPQIESIGRFAKLMQAQKLTFFIFQLFDFSKVANLQFSISKHWVGNYELIPHRKDQQHEN